MRYADWQMARGQGKWETQGQLQGFWREYLKEWNCHQLGLEVERGNYKFGLGQVFKAWMAVGLPSREESAFGQMSLEFRGEIQTVDRHLGVIII